ncbi:adenylate/guanylate cyclase [Hyaloraphidium curvatum]|nr:adenylate/guanylate cyclase [Hyaloraphidium curvatum]
MDANSAVDSAVDVDAPPSPTRLVGELQETRATLKRTQATLRRAEERAHAVEQAVAPFLPRQFVEILGKSDFTEIRLGDARESKLTIFFLDIRGFTTLAEGMTPAEVFAFVNSFFAALVPEIEAHRGFVDKYIGDAIMALFPGGPGSPSGAEDAIAAANAVLAALDRFNAAREGVPVRVGIGLNTGPAIVGTVGTGERMETTVISDAVNLASRLESLTKVYGVPLIISEATLYALGHLPGPTTRFLDRIRVKGKNQPHSIYELFDSDPEPLREAKSRTRTMFEEAVALYAHKDAARALPLFESCLKEAPQDLPAMVYTDRCRAFLATGAHEGSGELLATTPWRDEFTVGVDKIDEQHHELLDAFNRLAPCLTGGDAEEVKDVLAFIDSYVNDHFGMEYHLMKDHDYPFMQEHLREHRSFVEHFRRLREDIESRRHAQPFLVFMIQTLLIDWFANHSTGTDRHLAKFLRRLWDGRSRSPSDERPPEIVDGVAEMNVPEWSALTATNPQ